MVHSLPKAGGVYRLINGTMGERSQKERINAVIALGQSDDPRAVRPLMDCCNDSDALIRRHATEALLKLRSGRAVDVLIERLKDKKRRAGNTGACCFSAGCGAELQRNRGTQGPVF